MNVEKLVVLFVATAYLAGCGQPAQPPPLKVAPKTKLAPAVPPGSESAAPGAPPPPPATTAAAAPVAPSGAPVVAAPGVPTASPGTDPLFYFRRDAEGRTRSDLEALQEAAIAYGRKAGMVEEAGKEPWPNLTDLSLLVKVGMLKALPAPPEGKKYTVDFKTQKVSLVNK